MGHQKSGYFSVIYIFFGFMLLTRSVKFSDLVDADHISDK